MGEVSQCETGGFNDPFDESLTLQELREDLHQLSFADREHFDYTQQSLRENRNGGLVNTSNSLEQNSLTKQPIKKSTSYITGKRYG